MTPRRPLRLIAVLRPEIPDVAAAWDVVGPALAECSEVEIAAVDTGLGFDSSPGAADVVLVLGGDGAILRTCRQMGRQQLPIVGINLGRLGFLADVSVEEFRQRLPQLIDRRYEVVSHLMFEAELIRDGACILSSLGLNEAAVSSGGALRLIDVELAIDGEAVTTYSGDGVIISTPVGSTAHSLSAGGPILRQDLRAFVVTPICPHALTIRPVVDAADREYVLSVPRIPEGVTLVIDGQVRQPLQPHDIVRVRAAAESFQLVKLPQHSYYGTLHRKLGWAGQPRYQSRRRRRIDP